MNKVRQTTQAIRYVLLTSAAFAAGHAPTVLAAGSNTPAQLGKVTVTGTRIKRSNIETAQPITRISRQQIQQSGYTNVSQILGRLSFSGGHANNRGNFSDGRTTVSLRNLGANRNLVLVNGKRWLQGLGGTTNLNTIPTSIIDHIEILQDGASAVYGSDAIAGVINIITIKNYKGAEAHAHYAIHNGDGHWDGQTKQYDFTIGGGNDRGNVVFNTTYRQANPIPYTHRKLPRTFIAGQPPYVGAAGGGPRGQFRLFGPAVSGRTFGQGTCGTYNPDNPTHALCVLSLQNVPARASLGNFRNLRDTDNYNELAEGEELQARLKDVDVYVQGHYDLFDNVTFTANASYVREEARRIESSDPIRIGVQSGKTANQHKVGISGSNPYNPFGVDLVASTNAPCLAAGSCIGAGLLVRHIVEAGPRVRVHDRDNFHIFAGFNGYVNLFHREIDWDVGFAQNRAQTLYTQPSGYFNLDHVERALGPASQCTSPCVPLNFFGGAVPGDGGSITQDQIKYLEFEAHDIAQSNIRDWTANLSSDVYNLPAGPIGVAIGYERVDNYGLHHPGPIWAAGNGTDHSAVTPLLNGRVVRNAEYAELNIPLLADKPGVKSLSIDIANRWTQFKRSGGPQGEQPTVSFVHNSSGRLNIRYQPINDLLLRASWSQGFRSPNVNDLFGGQNHTNNALVDPCAGGANGGYTGGALPPNCPNHSEDAQPNYLVSGTAGSNPNLRPEKSVSRTLGFVYSPSQVSGLDVNADYFKIEINNAIGTIGEQNIVNGCFRNFSFCDLVETTGNVITNILNIDTNVGSLLTEGIDVGLHYKLPSTPIGDFDARIQGTFLTKYDQTNINRATTTGFATSHLLGVDPHPRKRFNGYLTWDYGNWSARYRIEYIGDTVSQCGVPVQGYCTYPHRNTDFQGAPNQFNLGRQHMGATVYHDINVNYTVPSINTTFSVGVNNLFDKQPPIDGSGGFDIGYYRDFSRLVYGDVRVRF